MAAARACPPILLTRAPGSLDPLGVRLSKAGRRCILFPALSIAAAPDQAPLEHALSHLTDYALVVFVSPNAIDHALAALRGPWPAAVPIAVMGPGSRQRLAQHGIAEPQFRIISPAQGLEPRFDSEALFAALDVAALRDRRCLMIRGNGGRTWLADALAAAQVHIDSVASYQRGPGQPEPAAQAQVAELIAQDQSALLWVTSSEALGMLKAQFKRLFAAPGEAWLLRQTVLVTHARIAKNARAQGFCAVQLSRNEDDAFARALEYGR